MKNIYILLLLSITFIKAEPVTATEPQTGWSYDQSTQQSFYMFEEITIDGDIVVGDGSGVNEGDCYTSGNCDVVGAFIDRDGLEICVGWRYASEAGYTVIPLMGAEFSGDSCYGLCDYLYPGEPAYLKIYDSSNGSILDLNANSDLAGFTLNEILIIWGTSTANNGDECDPMDGCSDFTCYHFTPSSEINNPSECEEFASEIGWEFHGTHCDSDYNAESNCVESGCYCHDWSDGTNGGEGGKCEWQDVPDSEICNDNDGDGPPDCIFDCPDFDILFAFFEEGEGDLSSDDICSIFSSWTNGCLVDCDDENLEEMSSIVTQCTECLDNGGCEGFFGDHNECDECHEECTADDHICHENCDFDYCGDDGDNEEECSGYADGVTLVENVYSVEDCQSLADSDEDINWEGYHCDAEMHCVEPGCYQFSNNIEWQESSDACIYNDEDECQYIEGHFICDDGSCVYDDTGNNYNMQCNGFVDCTDESDEANCDEDDDSSGVVQIATIIGTLSGTSNLFTVGNSISLEPNIELNNYNVNDELIISGISRLIVEISADHIVTDGGFGITLYEGYPVYISTNGDGCPSGEYDYCGICDGENIQTECYDIEECVDTFSIIGYNPYGDDWNDGSNCVNGFGFYLFDWEGGCIPDYYYSPNSGFTYYADPSWTEGFYFWGFEPSSSESFIFYFADGTSVEVNDVMNECEIEPGYCGDGNCIGNETFESCYDDCYYYEDCVDFTCDGEDWHDIDGEAYDCEAYAANDGWCESYGDDYAWCGMTANQACCGCMDTQSSDDDRNLTSKTKSGGYIHPFTSSVTQNRCPGEGPDVGCDGVCFSGLTEDVCGECGGIEENPDSCDYIDECDDYGFIIQENINSPEECENYSQENEAFYAGCYEDAESFCIEPGCYYGSWSDDEDPYYEYQDFDCSDHDNDDGPPDCIFDCPYFDIVDGENELSSDEACMIISSWNYDSCLDDCEGDDSEIIGMFVEMCLDCLDAENCDEVFNSNDECDECHDGCDGEDECHDYCDENYCDGNDDVCAPGYFFSYEDGACEECSVGNGELPCDDCICDDFGSETEQACLSACSIDFEDCCGIPDGDNSTCGGNGDINLDGALDILDITVAVDTIVNVSGFDTCTINDGDMDGDGDINVLDIIVIIDMILGGGLSRHDAPVPTSVELVQSTNHLSYNANVDGLIGFELTLSHGQNTEFILTDRAFIAEYNTSGNTTKMVIVTEVGNKLFSATRDFEIIDVIAGSAQSKIEYSISIVPEGYSLGKAYPNPFNPTTTLSFAIPVDAEVSLSIYNMQGREVSRLIDKNMDAGYHSVVWDANSYASGVYFVKMVAGEFVNTQKLMLVK